MQFEARGFSLLPKQPVDSLLSGRYASRLRGRGLMFEELRDYRPGDDIRTMDWKATARLRKAHVRVYSEERERPVLLVVDQRVNMFFGSARATKATAAAEFAALAAWRAYAVGDRVGAVLFNDRRIVRLRPQRSRASVLRICAELASLNQELSSTVSSDSTRLNESLRNAVHLANHDYLIILVTDYFGDDPQTQQLVTSLAARNDVFAALVYDPLGIAIRTPVPLNVTDGSMHRRIATDSTSAKKFERAFQDRCQEIQERLRSIRVPILPICTHDPVMEQLRMALGVSR